MNALPQPLLVAENVSLNYGNQPALREVGIEIFSAEVISLLGPNGSGKSTLIQSLFGYLQAQGRIDWYGKPLPKWSRRELARRVAYLPQTPTYQPGQTVSEVLELGRSPYWSGFGLESSRDAEIVARVAEQLSLNDILRRPVDELSGGQRQRVFIGRCLVQEPSALLLDEPNTYLDLKHQVELCQLLRQLSKTHSIAVLMASHDLNLAIQFSDRVVLLSQGKVSANGTVNVLTPELLSDVYGVRLEQIHRQGRPPVLIPDITPPLISPV